MARNRNDFKAIEQLAAAYGFRFMRTTSLGHLQWTKEKLVVVSPSVLGDPRTIKNVERTFRQVLRQAGESHGKAQD